MKKPSAIAIAAITLLPYASGIAGLWLLSHGHSESRFFGNQSNGFFGPFEFFILGEWALSLAIYSIHIQLNKNLAKTEKDRLRLRIWFLQIFAMLPYWYRCIWSHQDRAA